MEIEELVEFLSERFDHMDKRFDRVEIRLDKLEIRVGRLEDDMVFVKTNLANLAGQVDTLTQEVRVSNYRHERMENWAESAGKAIGVPFNR